MKLAALVLALLLVFSLPSCVDKPSEKEGTSYDQIVHDGFVPVEDSGNDSELCLRYNEYRENSELAFKDNEAAVASDFEYDITESGVFIRQYIGEDEIVVVPSDIDGVSVVRICEGAFKGAALRAVYVPDSVEHIEKGSFDECGGLSTLRLPFIGDGEEEGFLGYAFGASAYDENAVKVPASLDMLIVGNNTSEIAPNALRGCKSISAIILSDSIKEIGEMALYECRDLVYVSVGSGLEYIASYAFAYCNSLYEIDCSDVDDIDVGAFFNTSALNSISLKTVGDSENSYLGYIFGANDVEYHHKFVPDSLRTVKVSDECDEIGDLAFSGCRYLTSVYLGENVETVGIRAFYSCRSLKSIELGSELKKIEDDAFFGCESLVDVLLPQGLDSLGMQAFFGCSSLTSVSLPESLSEIKPATFYGCSSLASVTLGGVKTVGKDAFLGCLSLAPVSAEGIDIAVGNDALTGKK